MKKKSVKITILVLSISILFLAIATWFILPCFVVPCLRIPIQIVVMMNCETVKGHLVQYYEELKDKTPDDISSDFVNYLVDSSKDKRFSLKPPVEQYRTRRDNAFYLLLPTELESSNPILIAYTDPVISKNGKAYRGALFLRGDDIGVVTLEDSVLRMILGGLYSENRKADFYIWSQRLNYLKDQSQKGK